AYRNSAMAALSLGVLLTLPALLPGAESSNKGAAAPAGQPTFARHIAPILQAKCQECHRKGSLAPMSLVTYQETRPWAKDIKERVVERQMPPWHIDKTVGVQQFKNDMSLTDEQIKTIVRWVDSGAPPGDPKDMPPAIHWPDSNVWRAAEKLGQPDLIVNSEPYTMAAHHQDVWWRPMSNIPVTEARWVRAVEIRPGTLQGRRITHHAVAYLAQDDPGGFDPGGIAELRGRAMLMEWAIGKGYDLYHPNTGKLLLPGSQISWDIHIHAVGSCLKRRQIGPIFRLPGGSRAVSRSISGTAGQVRFGITCRTSFIHLIQVPLGFNPEHV